MKLLRRRLVGAAVMATLSCFAHGTGLAGATATDTGVPSTAENGFVHGAIFRTSSLYGTLPVKSWKSLRDARIVKQDKDFSCGSASLATLLNEFYGQSVTEEQLLKAMDKGDLRASFEDMQRALLQFGFKAQGYAATYEQLTKLKAPVVVYLKFRKDDHFSVLRGIDANTVWLADPSLGNRTYSREQFLEMWETRKDDQANTELKGKILAVLPNKGEIAQRADFFSRAPQRQTAQAVQLQSIRLVP